MLDEYQECLEFLYNRLNYEWLGMPRSSELRIGRMRRLLRRLGDPQDALRIVHIAGTKGKGSTAAMLAAALSGSGVKTGLFCSPHLHRLEERFTTDGQAASAAEMIELTDAVRPVVSEIDAEAAAQGLRGPTFFEMTTAMGLVHFARQRTGAVVLEVGMGGRLDSTNAIEPVLSVITSISYDHTRQLGATLEAIATEKAGILKRGRPAVVGVRAPEALAPIERIASQRRCLVRRLDRDFSYEYTAPERPLERPVSGSVSVQTWRQSWEPFAPPLLGSHQAVNAAVALASLDALAEQGIRVEPEAVSRGFARLAWPARVEVVGESPWLVVDGAHNVASAEALADTLRTCFPTTRRTLIFGTTRDKDLRGQLRALLPLFETVVATRYVENPRAVPPVEVAEAVHALAGIEACAVAEPAEALALARSRTTPEGLICVTGSLFLAAEMRAIILNKSSVPAPSRVVT